MPCEVTPIPFVEQQLPYNPKFVRDGPEVSGNGDGSLAGGTGGPGSLHGPGPAAAAASVLISPSPGGVAGPHNAIPALPDAGYTAPGLRATTLGLNLGAPSSVGSSMGDGHGSHAHGTTRPGYGQSSYVQDAFDTGSQYGHASIGGDYGHQQGYAPSSYTQHHTQAQSGHGYIPPAPMSTISSASWSNSNTFPAPRRASNQALVPPLNQSTIAPKGVSHRHDTAIDPRHHHLDGPPYKHHAESRGHGSHAPPLADDWDARSDASYYARPKACRTRSGSSLSDITTTTANKGGHGHHHAHSHSHHISAHNTPRGSPLHGQSPLSPSPLARELAPGSIPRSPLSPQSPVEDKHSRKISGFARADPGAASMHTHESPYKPVTPLLDVPDPRGRGRHPSSERRHRHHSASYESKMCLHPGLTPGYASDDESRYSARSRSRGREKNPHAVDHHNDPGRHHNSSRHHHKHRAEAYPDEQDDRESSRDGHRSQSNHSHHNSHGHGKNHRPRSHSHVPPPLPYRGPSPAPPGTLHPGHHGNHDQHLMPDIGALSISSRDHGSVRGHGQETRRRAHSMQYHNQSAGAAGHGPGQYVPSPASLAGFGPGAAGGGGLHQAPPSMLGEGFDDGASVAGSAMTFMDGAMGGRTSQYGLPKYPHQAKPDPRRFMVQRGKADVYLD